MKSIRSALTGCALALTSGLSGGYAMAEDTPEFSTPELTHVMSGRVDIGPPRAMGDTPLGSRREIPIMGGRFTGPDFSAEVLPGGSDWQLQRADGGLEIVAEYTLKTDDGVFIKVRNAGISFQASETRDSYTMTSPTFAAPASKYEWLNEAIFVGTLSLSADMPPKVVLDYFKVMPGN